MVGGVARAWPLASRRRIRRLSHLRSGRSRQLAIYFVRGQSADGPVQLTLQEAMAVGAVRVHETGNVSELAIENIGDQAGCIGTTWRSSWYPGCCAAGPAS
jgi:hypothetical protein